MKYPLLALIKLYQWTISPLLGPVCKYYPSCSHYGYTAIDRHGAVKGTALTAWRILRCNPWSLGGVDHVPPRKRPRWHGCCVTPGVHARAGPPPLNRPPRDRLLPQVLRVRRTRPQRPRPMPKEHD
ncbi:Putative membrane protein insertion efficiency factor [Streptomyces tendae]